MNAVNKIWAKLTKKYIFDISCGFQMFYLNRESSQKKLSSCMKRLYRRVLRESVQTLKDVYLVHEVLNSDQKLNRLVQAINFQSLYVKRNAWRILSRTYSAKNNLACIIVKDFCIRKMKQYMQNLVQVSVHVTLQDTLDTTKAVAKILNKAYQTAISKRNHAFILWKDVYQSQNAFTAFLVVKFKVQMRDTFKLLQRYSEGIVEYHLRLRQIGILNKIFGRQEKIIRLKSFRIWKSRYLKMNQGLKLYVITKWLYAINASYRICFWRWKFRRVLKSRRPQNFSTKLLRVLKIIKNRVVRRAFYQLVTRGKRMSAMMSSFHSSDYYEIFSTGAEDTSKQFQRSTSPLNQRSQSPLNNSPTAIQRANSNQTFNWVQGAELTFDALTRYTTRRLQKYFQSWYEKMNYQKQIMSFSFGSKNKSTVQAYYTKELEKMQKQRTSLRILISEKEAEAMEAKRDLEEKIELVYLLSDQLREAQKSRLVNVLKKVEKAQRNWAWKEILRYQAHQY